MKTNLGRNQSGAALVMAMVALVILTCLVLAVLSLGSSEVVIANNLASTSQARALAESGLEWAMANLNDSGGTPWVTAYSLDVNGISVGTFSTVPTWASPMEVSVLSTGITTGSRPATQVCRVTLILDPLTSRWNQKPGTWRQS